MIAAPISVPVTPEKVTPIKPSEAIRLGCLLAPVQAFGNYGSGNEACVLGALRLGLRLEWWSPGAYAITDRLEDLECPVAGCRGGLIHPLAHLNDTHEWTREAIADWLEGQGL